MDITQEENDMKLASGIAAFEAKHFTQAMKLLSPLAEDGSAAAQYRLAGYFGICGSLNLDRILV